MKKKNWHRIPHRLHFLCILPAAVVWSFGYCHAQITNLEPLEERREYDLYFFHLLETERGEWYIRIG
jgi:hypothetical protein